jgi:hypothetical protein
MWYGLYLDDRLMAVTYSRDFNPGIFDFHIPILSSNDYKIVPVEIVPVG